MKIMSENWREVEPKNTSKSSKNKDRKIVEKCVEKQCFGVELGLGGSVWGIRG